MGQVGVSSQPAISTPEGGAVLCNLPFIHQYQDRHNRWRYYFRRKGCKRVKLPGEPGSVEFLKAYTEAKDGKPANEPTADIAKDSLEALIRSFRASADFTQLSAAWQQDMGYVLNKLVAEHGPKPVRLLGKRHIVDMKNALKHKPGACNKMLRVLRQVLDYGVETEVIKENPFTVGKKIKLMKLGRYRAWTDKELAQYEKAWPLGTLERFIFDTALYSGQRAADLCKLTRKAIVLGRAIKLTQRKTSKPMTLRIHSAWKASMDAYLPTHKAPTLIAGREGGSIEKAAMSDFFRVAKRAAGLPEDCVLHGLRKSTARILAEHGVKSAPVTGHVTRAMQDEYERDANQAKMASAAIVKWDSKKRRKL